MFLLSIDVKIARPINQTLPPPNIYILRKYLYVSMLMYDWKLRDKIMDETRVLRMDLRQMHWLIISILPLI